MNDRELRGEALTRRQVLKAALIGGAAIFVPTFFVKRAGTAYAEGAPTHPDISPLRVVGLHDPQMTTEEKIKASWSEQDPLVRTDVVHASLDKLACKLAEEKDAKPAWKRIFLKPPDKNWSDAVVAIKTNEIAQQHTRSAVMSGICLALIGVGVKPENIHIYDACHGKNISPFKELPQGVVVANQWGGMTAEVAVPAPYKQAGALPKCPKVFAEGRVDILVNIALCKGHSTAFGSFTMAMKNHYGTFTPSCRMEGSALDYLISINKSSQILGEFDDSGKVVFPRQQLCVVDAIWASQPGPGGPPTAQPNRIFMGTFAPVVDYQVATNFRQDTMKWRITENAAARFLSDFGVKREDLPNGGKIIEVA